MRPRSGRRPIPIVSIALIMLAGAATSVLSAQSARQTISLDAMQVAFELPAGFTIFQWESSEGFYATIVYFGKDFHAGHFMRVPFEVSFWPGPQDCPRNVSYSKPSECIDVEYRRVKENVQHRTPGYNTDPEYVKLFGNKAVRYTVYNPSRKTLTIGYLSRSQLAKPLPGLQKEYLARITVTENAPQPAFDEAYKILIDTVFNSLRVIR